MPACACVQVIKEVPVEVVRTVIKEVPKETIKEVPVEVIKVPSPPRRQDTRATDARTHARYKAGGPWRSLVVAQAVVQRVRWRQTKDGSSVGITSRLLARPWLPREWWFLWARRKAVGRAAAAAAARRATR